MSTPLFQNPKAAAKVCILGGMLNPMVFFVTAAMARSAHDLFLNIISIIVAIQILAQLFFILTGLVTLSNLPKENRREIAGPTVAGIIIGIGLGFFMFILLVSIFFAHGGC